MRQRQLDEALAIILEHHPGSEVAAINEAGVVVPIPSTVPIGNHRTLPVRSTLASVVPADRVVIVELYAQARSVGVASAAVHRIDQPDQAMTLFLVDQRAGHGVVVAVFAESLDTEEAAGHHLPEALPPRLARMGKDGSAVYTWIDSNVPRILGWSAEDLVGRRALEIVHPQDQEAAIGNWIDMLHTSGPGRSLRLRHQHRDGHWVWLEVTNHNHLNDDGTGEVVADIVDISDEMATHAALEAREHLLNQLAQTVPLGLVHSAPDGTILFANDQLTDILGVATSTTLEGLFSRLAAEDRPKLDAAVRNTLQGAQGSDIEIRIDLGTTYRYCTARFRSLHDGDTCSGIIGCFEDVTISVHLRQDLEVQATFDPLTECRNRASTLDALQRSLDRHHHRDAAGTAVVFVDLDQFKPVNDRLGHAAGDHLLAVAARRIQDALRSNDVVGRIGGDEFLAIAANVRQVRDAMRIAQNVMTHLCQPVDLGGTVVRLAASAGVAWTDDPEAEAEAVVAAADQAMYLSKQEGRCRPLMAAAPFGQQPDPAATATPIRTDGASQPAPTRPAATPSGSAPPAATAQASTKPAPRPSGSAPPAATTQASTKPAPRPSGSAPPAATAFVGSGQS